MTVDEAKTLFQLDDLAGIRELMLLLPEGELRAEFYAASGIYIQLGEGGMPDSLNKPVLLSTWDDLYAASKHDKV